MSDQTHSENLERNHDYFTGRAAGEDITISGGASCVLRIDSEPQLTAMGLLGNLGMTYGKVIFDATKTRHLAYDGDSNEGDLVRGDVIVGGTSGATGELLSVDTTNNILKLRSVTGGPFQDNEALTCTTSTFTANANGADTVGTLLILREEGYSWQADVAARAAYEGYGEWYELGISSGGASQTFENWHNDVVAGVQVETGNGTGVYEWWPNIGQVNFNVYDGTSEWSKVCKMSFGDATITFGDGTNGKIPVSGAKIRVPNLHLASSTTAASPTPTRAATRSNIPWYGGGNLKLDKVSFGTVIALYSGCPYDCEVTNCSFSTVSSGNGITYGLNKWRFHDCCFGGDGGGTGGQDYGVMTGMDYKKVEMELKRCVFFTHIGSYVSIKEMGNFDWDDVKIIPDAFRDSSSPLFQMDNCYNGVINNWKHCNYALNFNGCKSIEIANLVYNDAPSGTNTSSQEQTAISFVGGCDGIKIDGITFPNAKPYAGVFYLAKADNCKIRNIGTFSSPVNFGAHTNYLFRTITASGQKNEISNCFATNLRGSLYYNYPFSVLPDKFILRNMGDFGTAAIAIHLNNSQYRQLQGNPDIAAGYGQGPISGLQGTHFMDFKTGATAGKLNIIFSPKTDYYNSANAYTVVSGTPIFDLIGGVYLPAAGDEVIWEWQYDIMGHTGFANSTPTKTAISGTVPTVYYAIDKLDGNGYGAFKEATGANLSGETVSATGFRMKIKFKNESSPSADRNIKVFSIETTTTNTDWEGNPQPLLDYAPVVLKNVKDGSSWTIKNIVTDEEQSGVQSGTGDIETTFEVLGASNPMDINVRKGTAGPKYRPFRTQPRITEDGLDVWVEQIADPIA